MKYHNIYNDKGNSVVDYSIYLLNYTSKKLDISLVVVFHHPLPISVFEILSSQTKFNILFQL